MPVKTNIALCNRLLRFDSKEGNQEYGWTDQLFWNIIRNANHNCPQGQHKVQQVLRKHIQRRVAQGWAPVVSKSIYLLLCWYCVIVCVNIYGVNRLQ